MRIKKFKSKTHVVQAYQTDKKQSIKTLDGIKTAKPGDWVVINKNGEKSVYEYSGTRCQDSFLGDFKL